MKYVWAICTMMIAFTGLFGCAGESSGAKDAGNSESSNAGDGDVDDDEPCAYSICDIQDSACAEETARVVACHLDVPLSMPRIRYVTRDELQAEFDAAVTERSEEEALVNWASHQRNQLLGLEPEGYTDSESISDYLDTKLAFYDSSKGLPHSMLKFSGDSHDVMHSP